jgi:murein DD-endopeptidase MepM/ murein hydrolase activator NlpD
MIDIHPVFAQDTPTYPIYIVQPGETLTQIAIKLNVSVDEIIQINNLANPNLITEGTRLYIPGLEGISGVLTAQIVGVGETLSSFVKISHYDFDFVKKVNHLTSPSEVYAGSSLIVPIDEEKEIFNGSALLQNSQSLLEVALLQQLNIWELIEANQLDSTPVYLPGDLLFFQSAQTDQVVSPISPLLESVTVNKLPLKQGATIVLEVSSKIPVNLIGSLNNLPLNFFSSEEKSYYALQGIHAMAEPGLVDFMLQGTFENNQSFSFEQMLLLESSGYGKDPPINVKDETIDPTITIPEDDFVKSLVNNVTTQKFWSGQFMDPVDPPLCYKSVFGSRRSYNNSEYIYFHTGLDYGVCAPSLNIYAAAPGKVVFAGPLTVRGNTIYIDHGQGIFSGYFHQAEIKVKEGDIVQQGQLIGLIGATGRVTGPHLHFEIWVNGVQVNPVDWLENIYP